MINTIVDIDDIEYTFIKDDKLIDSISKRGIAIAVHVYKYDDKYKCIDGNKRISAMKVLSEIDDKYRRIPVLILNDYSKAGSSFWGNTQNKH